MEILQVENLSFKYAAAESAEECGNVLKNVSFSVRQGEFILVCGESGCGKTTLLRLLKREIAPAGTLVGKIIYMGKSVTELDARVSASEIGFVRQNPEDQIVTDKVWHELAFGLENLGLETAVIRRRIAEMADYFGIGNWYHSNTDELSGGQKQLLNLAAVMAMQPEVLILDEPTAQLDPIAATDFIKTLKKINDELGTTIIISEHRLEELFPLADLVLVLDDGKLYSYDTPRKTCELLKNHKMEAGLPSAARIYIGTGNTGKCPMTVREGREFLNKYLYDNTKVCNNASEGLPKAVKSESDFEDTVIEANNVWFRYEKDRPDILSDFCIKVNKGDTYALLGGNGAGKTTALNVIAGLDKAYRGKIKIKNKKINEYKGNSLYRGNLALLPQNPSTVFVKDTVREDLEMLANACGADKQKVYELAEEFKINELLKKNPYDLSGGEQQKCALVKMLLTEPEIILMDEPTKGLDPVSKQRLREIIKGLNSKGKTVLIVTHDIEFAAEVSNRCALLFDGKIISEGTPGEFFGGNNFYTTAANRISRAVFNSRYTILCEEVIALCNEERIKRKKACHE